MKLFYSLVLSSMLACALLAGRMRLSGSWTYVFLVWNLFLAWVPYLCSLWAVRTQRLKPDSLWRLIIPAGVWLIFLPNAPYILTDFVHLRPRHAIPLWYDIALIGSFAWAGCFLAIVSLYWMEEVVKAALGTMASRVFVISSVLLSGLGVYLGRFLRWNSWDLLFSPHAILADIAQILANGARQPRPLILSCLLAMVLLAGYRAFTRLIAAPATERNR
jgi:uncharacterized membrane protein